MNELMQHAGLRERFYRRDRRSARAARRFAVGVLEEWGLAGRTEEVALCVSELVTNALLHGVPPGRGLLLRMRYGDGVLRVEVHDSGPAHPRIREGSGDAEGGRGLPLVAALGDRWGVAPRPGAPGKAVWCEWDEAG
ncbi:ATP-binding protein [Streptomyces sp. NPDC002644]